MKSRSILIKKLVLIFCFFFTLPHFVKGQEKITLQGKVTDPLKSVIVGADVIITLNNTSFKTKTNKEGVFSFIGIMSGKYSVFIKAKGFIDYKIKEIYISGKENNFLQIELEVGLGDNIEVAIDDRNKINTDSGSNLNQTVLQDGEIDILPDDPEALAQALKSLTTAPNALDGNGQFFVDGLEGGRLPPKASIAQVRVNQNPLNAEFDRVGFNRVDIFTKPGADKIKGSASFNFSDESLVSRNSFLDKRFPYQTRLYSGNLSGSIIPNKSSFFLDVQKRDEDNTTTVNARVLDPNFNPVNFFSAPSTPIRFTTFSPRVDLQLTKNSFLVGRYAFTENKLFNRGIGDFALPERAYSTANNQHLFQLIGTSILNPNISNEFRLQYTQDVLKQNDSNAKAGIIVQEAFSAGGAGVGLSRTKTKRIELQNYLTAIYKGHTMRFGVRLRGISINDNSLPGFNGFFIFTGGIAPQLNSNNQIVLDGNGNPVLIQINSLERYRRTVLLTNVGLLPAEIRTRGGGANQLAVTTGNPIVKINQIDVGFFFQDEWRLRPNLSVGAGIRYENQSNIKSNYNFAPRVFFAFAPGNKQTPKTVIRSGFGIFYDRTSEQVTFQSRRFAQSAQLRYFITDPVLLNRFPNVPTALELNSLSERQSVTQTDTNIQSPYAITFIGNIERQLPYKIQAYIYAYTYRVQHNIRLRNINAPMTGSSGLAIRPFPNRGEILSYESSGNFSLNQATFGLRKSFKGGSSFFTSYILGKAKSDSETLPANSYDLTGEFGRASFDTRHRFIFGGTFIIPKAKITLTPFIVANTGRPFNITTGIDNNRDNSFTDRPALADSTTLPENLVITPYGRFDITPATNKKLIVRNYGQGPSFFSINIGATRNFNFSIRTKENKQVAGASAANNSESSQKFSSGRKISLALSVQVQNLLNSTNKDVPNGNLSSPFFGKSVRIVPAFGTGSPGGFNRRIEVGLRLNF
jgi:hypothetical protein